jgi:hypothetical protein
MGSFHLPSVTITSRDQCHLPLPLPLPLPPPHLLLLLRSLLLPPPQLWSLYQRGQINGWSAIEWSVEAGDINESLVDVARASRDKNCIQRAKKSSLRRAEYL